MEKLATLILGLIATILYAGPESYYEGDQSYTENKRRIMPSIFSSEFYSEYSWFEIVFVWIGFVIFVVWIIAMTHAFYKLARITIIDWHYLYTEKFKKTNE